jgi:putative transcriptional regulator
MPFIYDKAFALLKDRGITTYNIRKDNLISQAALTKMKNNTGSIDTRTLERLCALLNCQPGDLMEYVPSTASDGAQEPQESEK